MKDRIIKYLEKCELDDDINEFLIDELIFNIELAKTAKEDIIKNGIKINITRNHDKKPFYQKNRAIDIYTQALKGITLLCTKLCLTPSDRQKLKIERKDAEDRLDKLINS